MNDNSGGARGTLQIDHVTLAGPDLVILHSLLADRTVFADRAAVAKPFGGFDELTDCIQCNAKPHQGVRAQPRIA